MREIPKNPLRIVDRRGYGVTLGFLTVPDKVLSDLQRNGEVPNPSVLVYRGVLKRAPYDNGADAFYLFGVTLEQIDQQPGYQFQPSALYIQRLIEKGGFTDAGGGLNVAGEAGQEAKLARIALPGGNLGVQAAGGAGGAGQVIVHTPITINGTGGPPPATVAIIQKQIAKAAQDATEKAG